MLSLRAAAKGPLAISTTGSVAADGRVVSAGMFDGYRDIRWDELLDGVPAVFVTNDGRASSYAEYWRRRTWSDSLAHFVIGTGVGGGLVDRGGLVVGADGLAGLFGHIKIDRTSRIPCSCRNFGCVEL